MSLGRRNWWEQQLHFSSNGRVFVLPFFVTENSFSSRSINRTDLVENAQKWFRTCVCGVCVRVLWIICYDVAKTIFIACDMINATFGKVKKKNHRHKSTAIQIKMGCTRCVRAPKITIQMKCEFVVLNASTELNLFLASFDVNNLFPVEKKKTCASLSFSWKKIAKTACTHRHRARLWTEREKVESFTVDFLFCILFCLFFVPLRSISLCVAVEWDN